MSDKEILEYSQKTKAEAISILAQTNLINILKEFGEVKIYGSFKYDLMWGPDIDIMVICTDSTRETSLKALNRLIKEKISQKYDYGDFVTFKTEGRPESYILTLKLPYNDRKWEIEIWFFDNIPATQEDIDKLISSKLNEENRLEILRIKEDREINGLTKHSLNSFDIYKRVLV